MIFRFPMSPPEFEVRKPSDLLGGFEFRPAAYLALLPGSVYRHGAVDLSQWNAYSSELDGDLREWDERANKHDCWRDWWKTGRDWIEPEKDE